MTQENNKRKADYERKVTNSSTSKYTYNGNFLRFKCHFECTPWNRRAISGVEPFTLTSAFGFVVNLGQFYKTCARVSAQTVLSFLLMPSSEDFHFWRIKCNVAKYSSSWYWTNFIHFYITYLRESYCYFLGLLMLTIRSPITLMRRLLYLWNYCSIQVLLQKYSYTNLSLWISQQNCGKTFSELVWLKEWKRYIPPIALSLYYFPIIVMQQTGKFKDYFSTPRNEYETSFKYTAAV